MPIDDYIVKSDRFIPIEHPAGLAFPCNICQYGKEDQFDFPCSNCGHNLNAKNLDE